MIIILKDKGVIVPDEDVKYLDEVKDFFKCDIEGFRKIAADDFVRVLSAVMFFSGDLITLANGKTIQVEFGQKKQNREPKKKKRLKPVDLSWPTLICGLFASPNIAFKEEKLFLIFKQYKYETSRINRSRNA